MNEIPPASPTPAEKKPKGLWEHVLTTTPIVLTVVATVLASQSSGEMTRAQYHRSLAGQNQSKVGDQWSFFQAKRTRKIILEKTEDVLDALAVPEPVEPATLQAAADRLPGDFEIAQREAQRLIETIGKASLGKDAGALQAAAEELLRVAKKGAADAEGVKKKTAETLRPSPSNKQLQDIFGWLNNDEFPRVEEHPIEDEHIKAASTAIGDRQPDLDVNPLVMQVQPEALRKAIATAEENARHFDAVVKPMDDAIRTVSDLVNDQVKVSRDFYRAARNVRLALIGLPTEEAKVPGDLRDSVDRLDRHAAAVKTSADELNIAFKAAHNRFTAHRYESEAKANQDVALLYEIQVHQSSVQADRHLERSRNFFYGLLAAQLGVTISTLALAVRQKSLLWGLASLAGAAAVLYSVSVYFDLIPY